MLDMEYRIEVKVQQIKKTPKIIKFYIVCNFLQFYNGLV